MGTCSAFFAVGLVVFASLHVDQWRTRAGLLGEGVASPVTAISFIEQNERRLNPNTSRYDDYSDDQVEFTFVLGDGREFSALQPIAEDRYDELGPLDELSALHLTGDPDGAELLQADEFVANRVPYWAFAAISALLALACGVIAWSSSRPRAATT